MIVLDTNVVSEPLKSTSDPAVTAWLDQQILETLFLTTISLAELRYGVAALPDGRRKKTLGKAIENQVVALFGSRLLGFDESAATVYAELRSRAKSAGITIGTADAYIAATAAANGFTVATRDVEPYQAAGLRVVNPWEAS